MWKCGPPFVAFLVATLVLYCTMLADCSTKPIHSEVNVLLDFVEITNAKCLKVHRLCIAFLVKSNLFGPLNFSVLAFSECFFISLDVLIV